MESLEQPVSQRADYRVVLLDDLAPTWSDPRAAAIGTAIVHLALILGLLLVPQDTGEPPPDRERHRVFTKLIDPPTRLTQKAPNKSPISPELSVAPSVKSPRIAPVVRKRFEPPPPPQVAQVKKPSPALPQEPPKVNTAQPQQTVQIMPPAVLTQPPTRAPEQPKLVLEAPPAPPQSGQGTGRLKVTGGGIQEAIRELATHGATSSRSVGDDTDETVTPGSITNAPASSRPKASLEIMSDPKGVDMKPYLLQVLQDVRRNWLTIYPESARLGRRGRVVVQFAIAPNGKILKVVFTTESGATALDRAAVAALSMSDPLPQLPAAFKGDRVVLQFTFLYNAPR